MTCSACAPAPVRTCTCFFLPSCYHHARPFLRDTGRGDRSFVISVIFSSPPPGRAHLNVIPAFNSMLAPPRPRCPTAGSRPPSCSYTRARPAPSPCISTAVAFFSYAARCCIPFPAHIYLTPCPPTSSTYNLLLLLGRRLLYLLYFSSISTTLLPTLLPYLMAAISPFLPVPSISSSFFPSFSISTFYHHPM